MNSRERLISSMNTLMWERGYDATSPNQVIEHSGTGKGSFYHHFKGKKELGIAAMEARSEELIAEFERIFSTDKSWLEKCEKYFFLPRNGLKGCRIGRIAQDPSLLDPQLRAPMKRYFQYLLKQMEKLFDEAKAQSELPKDCDTHNLALTAISVLQGGFVLSRATNQKKAVRQASLGFLQILKSLSKKT